MRESKIERYLCEQIKLIGGIAYKFTSPQRRSVPDRLVVLPYGKSFFVECKAPDKEPTPAQKREAERLRALRQAVYVVDTIASVDALIREYA